MYLLFVYFCLLLHSPRGCYTCNPQTLAIRTYESVLSDLHIIAACMGWILVACYLCRVSMWIVFLSGGSKEEVDVRSSLLLESNGAVAPAELAKHEPLSKRDSYLNFEVGPDVITFKLHDSLLILLCNSTINYTPTKMLFHGIYTLYDDCVRGFRKYVCTYILCADVLLQLMAICPFSKYTAYVLETEYTVYVLDKLYLFQSRKYMYISHCAYTVLYVDSLSSRHSLCVCVFHRH